MNKPGILYRFLSVIFKLFTKKPEIINLNDEIDDQAIFVSNHSAASGPFMLSIHFPKMFRPWGIYHMCFGYRQRWNYLYHTFYQQKLGKSKFKAFIAATLMGLVTGLAYRSMKVIPSYEDGRLVTTIKESIKHIEQNQSVLIFPEDSSQGYHDVLNFYHPGFVFLSEQYKKKNDVDLPVYSVYYNKRKNAFIIDKPRYLARLFKESNTRENIAKLFKDRANELRLILHEKLDEIRQRKEARKNARRKTK